MMRTAGESTLKIIGAVDWDAEVYGRVPVTQVVPPLIALAGAEPDEIIIGVAELLCLVLPAAIHRKARWGRLVLYASDNTNV